MMLYVLHDKYTIIDIKTTWREKIPSSSRLVWKLASPNRYVVRADVREKGFSTHNATYRGGQSQNHEWWQRWNSIKGAAWLPPPITVTE